MNKRQKLKNGIIHKKCDSEHCWKYRLIVKEQFFTNNSCGGCRHVEHMNKIIENGYKDINDTRFCQFARNLNEKKIIRTYPYMENHKCLGLVNREKDHPTFVKCKWHYKEREQNGR